MNDIQRIGDAPLRREDQRFVTGAGQYLDDLRFDGMVHAGFLRSPYAHADILSIDASGAKAAPGVLAVLTAEDAEADGLNPIMPFVTANTQTDEPFAWDAQPLLAGEQARFPGETVAMVVAETKAAVLDAIEAIQVDYGERLAVIDPFQALEPDAPQISEAVPGNRVLQWTAGAPAEVARAIQSAAHVAHVKTVNHRVVTNPIEPRGGVGVFDPDTGKYVLHVSSQNVHINRNFIADALGEPAENVRWIAPDVGGGFGAKNFVYPEQALLLWAAKRVGRPVKWIASRSETILTDHQSRGHFAEGWLAADEEGRFLGLQVESVADLGGYVVGSAGGVQTFQYAHFPGGQYRIPQVGLGIQAALTNQVPLGVMRGPGFAEMNNIVERLIDRLAKIGDFDRFDLRRRNLAGPRSMPFRNPIGSVVDSGDFPAAFDAAIEAAGVRDFEARRAASALPRGVGVACHIKATGGSPDENAEVRFKPDGGVDLIMGTQTIGQGHETTFPQMLATKLGIPNHLIRLVHGDTGAIPFGGGHGSSRATYMGGTALWRAADEVIAKGRAIAGEMLQADVEDVSFDDGRFAAGESTVGLLDVAAEAERRGEPLSGYHFWTREAMTYPNGTHIAEVEVDPETGVVRLPKYTAADDYGVMVNPMIVAGQVHGAIAQGVGQALLEGVAVEAGSGQVLSGTFMDYAMPRADDLPSFDVSFHSTPCTTNPLGVKGCGEAGAIAGYPAVSLAIQDALREFGVAEWSGPASPHAIWRAIHEAKP